MVTSSGGEVPKNYWAIKEFNYIELYGLFKAKLNSPQMDYSALLG